MAERLMSPVFVGREDELATIEASFERVAAGEPAVVLVAGEAGVGKTRLAEEAVGHAARAGARVLIGRCVPLGDDGLPFSPLVDALRQLSRTTPPRSYTTPASVTRPPRPTTARAISPRSWG